MQKLDRRGLTISALSGFLVGHVVAWIAWKEATPPREHRQAAVKVAPTFAPVEPPAPASAPEVINEEVAELDDSRVPMEQLDIREAQKVNGRLVQNLYDDRKVILTMMPALQERAREVLEKAEVPYGAVVAIEPSTGRVLGLVDHSTADPNIQNLAGRANPPAASVFKLVTTVALLETTPVTPDYKTCFNGGARGISKRHLTDDPRRDKRCHTLTQALAKSTNAVFGKLTYRHLNAGVLRRYAQGFGWDQEIPFAFPVRIL